jgi:hypothetical protein
VKIKKTQKTTWIELELPDLRSLKTEHQLPLQEIVDSQDTIELALAALEHHLGFTTLEMAERTVATPVGEMRIERGNLAHIVEKRKDARERYVKYALATMLDPLEVWEVAYEDDENKEEFRLAYIGAFEGKHQMLVVVAQHEGKLLWNFMHTDSKSLNKHRNGEIKYRRPQKK